jgi:protocatechuate 3,4-dioxygenase, beta subunit
MSLILSPHDRRWFLHSLTVGIAAFSAPGAFAQHLMETATTTEGPFYPDKLPLDTDNDLLILNDAITPAVGSITLLTGRVLSPSGQPIRNAFVEIWQTDTTGSYGPHCRPSAHRPRSQLPGVRPFSHRRAGPLLLPHD